MKAVQEKLLSMQDLKYRDFQCKLMPTVDAQRVIGVRTPELRAYAKSFGKTEESVAFLHELPHAYYEEDNLHAFLIEQIKDFDTCIRELDLFLPYVNNWATCDSMKPGVLRKNPEQLMEQIRIWLSSSQTYTVRFGIECLMNYFLDDLFLPEHLQMVANIQSEEYYIRMMQAWYFATALAKQYAQTLPVLTEHMLPPWTHNKTIQKSVESFRITPEQKTYLRTLRIKGKS